MKKPTMEELFQTMPDLPEDLEEECYSHINTIPIFYRRKGKLAQCRCGKCNSLYITGDVPIRHKKTNCPECGTKAEWEWMRCSQKMYQYFTVYLIQKRTDGNLVARYFRVENIYHLGEPQYFKINETRRLFLNMGDFYGFNNSRYYNEDHWSTLGNGIIYGDYIYKGSREAIKDSNFRYFTRMQSNCLIDELKAYARNPAMEMFEKMNLRAIRHELFVQEGRSKYINRRGKDVKAQLRLKDKKRINYLIKTDGDLLMLRVLQMEEKQGIEYTEEQREWLRKILGMYRGEEYISHVLRYMTFQKMYNRVKMYQKQLNKAGRYNRTPYAALNKYSDYLVMREELGYDMTNSVYIFPKNLIQKHDQMVEEKRARADELHTAKKEKEFQGIKERFQSLNGIYTCEAGGLFIRPAMSAEEIVNEGRTLHHCVGSDRYLKRHNDGETFILFLRKKEEPEKPYYTIEIKKNEILQWYGIKDTKPDKEIVEPWLNQYVYALKKREMRKAR